MEVLRELHGNSEVTSEDFIEIPRELNGSFQESSTGNSENFDVSFVKTSQKFLRNFLVFPRSSPVWRLFGINVWTVPSELEECSVRKFCGIFWYVMRVRGKLHGNF